MASVGISRFLFFAHATIVSNIGSLKFGAHGSANEVMSDSSPDTKVNAVVAEGYPSPSPPGESLPSDGDKISQLPGLDYDPGFDMFSGYLSISEKHQRNIFYWYVESQGDPSTDPVIFWTNGGPGCSGLLGFGTEHGPFLVSMEGELSPNKYAWNKLANIVYVEQPIGVGYSFSDKKSDYTTGDATSAKDNYRSILQFFEKFPERRSNDFYIASESYGGHYMPQLALYILEHDLDRSINFKGMMVGNPYVDPFTTAISMYQAWYNHGLLPWPLYKKYVQQCHSRQLYGSSSCSHLVDMMFEILRGGINLYALDYPLCREKPGTKVGGADRVRRLEVETDGQGLHDRKRVRRPHFSEQSSMLLNQTVATPHSPPFLPDVDRYYPCADNHWERYLNRLDVVSALHANESTLPWKACSSKVDYSQKDRNTPQPDKYKALLKMMKKGTASLDVLIYSGDDDSVCSLEATQTWIWDLGPKAISGRTWAPWYVKNQTAGFMTNFDVGNKHSSFSFATVHGAGHEIPSYRPMEALELLRRYLSKELTR